MKLEAVLFDYGNTLLEYRDFSLEALGGRFREGVAALAARIDGAEFDPDRLARGVWRQMEEMEALARVDLSEYDASAEILRALARETEGAVAVDAEWDARVDRVVFGVMRRALSPEPRAAGMLDECTAQVRSGILAPGAGARRLIDHVLAENTNSTTAAATKQEEQSS